MAADAPRADPARSCPARGRAARGPAPGSRAVSGGNADFPPPLSEELRMRLCLVEDHAVAGLEPLTLTRAVYELLLGGTTLGEKVARAFGVGPGPSRRGAVVRTYLAAVQRRRDPQTTINDRDW